MSVILLCPHCDSHQVRRIEDTRQMPIFSVDVTGRGVETVSGRTFSSGNPADYFAMSFVSAFEPPAPTPEPTTAALLGCALVGSWAYRRRAHLS